MAGFSDFPVTQVGSPTTSNATKVLLLGSGEIGKELTTSFQRLGLEVHAVDREPNAPAQQNAQFSHIADVRDPAQVRNLVARIRPDYVVPEVGNVAPDVLAGIENDGDAVVVPTARAAELTDDREGIRTIAHDTLGLPTTAYRFATTLEEFEDAFTELGYPCVIKPEAATSGRGHTLVSTPDEITEAWNNAHAVGYGGQVVVERFVDFDFEITILAVRSIDPATGELSTWFCEPIGHRHAGGDLTELWQPVAMNERAMENARSVAARITNELGGRGVYGVELFVAGDDVYFSSVTPRPLDTGMLTLRTQRFSQFDLHVRAILGLPIDATLVSPGAAVVVHAPQASTTVSYRGLTEALAVPEADVRIFGKTTAYAGRRMAAALATAETSEIARDRAAEAAGHIVVEC